jgi:hypothetical protein
VTAEANILLVVGRRHCTTQKKKKKKKEATSRTQMNEIYVKSKTKICPSLSKILKKLKQFHATEKVDMNGNKKKERKKT